MTRSDRHRSGAARSQPEPDRVAEVLRENQKLITLGRLTASIAHEINNPLESIMNLLYLMEQGKPENADEYLQLAQRELARVVQITQRALTFFRETRAPVRTEPAELIEEVLGLYARRISDKRLRIVRRYETREQVQVLPGEIRQVLSNLVANAIDASGERGRIVIRIHEAGYTARGECERGLRLSIGDNGPGICSEARKRLGQPFFTTKGESGTGLGLWVTQSILSRNGSRLQVRSSVAGAKHGTVCSFVLPLRLRRIEVINGICQEDPAESESRNLRGRGPRLVSRKVDEAAPERDQFSDEADNSARLLQMRACGD